MKLSKENISRMDKILFKEYGIIYSDIRLELLDHLATELEESDGSFDEVFEDFMRKKKDFIRETNLQLNRNSSRIGSKLLLKNILSIKFLLAYALIITVVYNLASINGKEWFMEYFDILPIIVPAPISLVILYSMFSKKRKSYSMSFAGVTNTVLMTYLFIFIHVIRKVDTVYWIGIFSFYMTLSIMYYFIYFFSVKKLQNL